MTRSISQVGMLTVGCCLVVGIGLTAGERDKASKADLEAGREIFVREWLPRDSRSKGGDGLGPVFNDSSCVACHNQGGVGGGGPNSKNVEVVTPFAQQQEQASQPSLLGAIVRIVAGGSQGKPKKPSKTEVDKKRLEKIRAQRAELAKHHPGFKSARSVVLHHFGVDPKFAEWRSGLTAQNFAVSGFNNGADEMLRLQGQMQSARFFFGPAHVGNFVFVVSQRNPISLFGAGELDSIPVSALKAAAETKHKGFPEITGRVAKLKSGKIGRFGWKAQKASLHDFVLTACATELGLEVPGNPQAGNPLQPKYMAPGLDLSEKQCNQLTQYIAALPSPKRRVPVTSHQKTIIESGQKHFMSVGCGTCHLPKLGEVKNVYSDLLLHDMGQELGDTGDYGSFAPNSTEEEEFTEPLPSFTNGEGITFGLVQDQKVKEIPKEEQAKLIGALRLEWRTPPLWGLRDSGPYLHDGRAATIEQAIALHGGEASKVRAKYFRLTKQQRAEVQVFLKSLTAP